MDRLVRFLFKRCMKDKNLRKLARRYWPEMTTVIDGQVFHLHPADNTTENLMYMNGQFSESDSLEFLKTQMRDQRCLLFDIGANCGAYTVPLASIVGAGSSVHAFEPSPVMAPRLIKNLHANALQSQVQIHQVALSSVDGQATLHVHPRNHGQSSLRELDRESHSITVDKHQLSRYVPAPLDADLFVIKIDVEGREDDVLFGFLDTTEAERLPDIILMEMVMEEQWTHDLRSLLDRLGYRVVFEGDGNAAFQRNNG